MTQHNYHDIKTYNVGKHTIEIDLDSPEDTLALFGANSTARLSLTAIEVVKLSTYLYQHRYDIHKLHAQLVEAGYTEKCHICGKPTGTICMSCSKPVCWEVCSTVELADMTTQAEGNFCNTCWEDMFKAEARHAEEYKELPDITTPATIVLDEPLYLPGQVVQFKGSKKLGIIKHVDHNFEGEGTAYMIETSEDDLPDKSMIEPYSASLVQLPDSIEGTTEETLTVDNQNVEHCGMVYTVTVTISVRNAKATINDKQHKVYRTGNNKEPWSTNMTLGINDISVKYDG